MEEKKYMTDLLTCAKSFCTLLLHGTVEASTPAVNSTMNQALFEGLSVQNAIYKQMESRGWYKVEQAPKVKIETTVNTLSQN